jgi:hypothetical protein
MSERWRQLALEKLNERILLRSDLNQDDVIVARPDIAIDRLEMIFRRWPAADEPRDRLRRDMLARRRERLGCRGARP